MPTIYLDNNATTPLAPEVIEVLHDAAEDSYANPSSAHRLGQKVRHRIELARQQAAMLIGATPREVTFTSGGTEANNLALRGMIEPDLWQRHTTGANTPAPAIITNKVEHAAVCDPTTFLESRGAVAHWVDVDSAGRVSPDAIGDALDALTQGEDASRLIVISIQWANNETGVLQPVEAIGEAVASARQRIKDAGARPRVYFHIDATQAVGKVPVNVEAAQCDLLTFSAHKFHGPKGIGALWCRRRVLPAAQQLGGSQERERRGGTENTLGILAIGKAAELAIAHLENDAECAQVRALRDRFECGLLETVPSCAVNSQNAPRLPNTASIAFPGVEAEAVLLGLSERGLCASAGAACSSGSLEASPVLKAMGLEERLAHGTVRFSLSRYTNEADIDEALKIIPRVIERLMKTMPTG